MPDNELTEAIKLANQLSDEPTEDRAGTPWQYGTRSDTLLEIFRVALEASVGDARAIARESSLHISARCQAALTIYQVSAHPQDERFANRMLSDWDHVEGRVALTKDLASIRAMHAGDATQAMSLAKKITLPAERVHRYGWIALKSRNEKYRQLFLNALRSEDLEVGTILSHHGITAILDELHGPMAGLKEHRRDRLVQLKKLGAPASMLLSAIFLVIKKGDLEHGLRNLEPLRANLTETESQELLIALAHGHATQGQFGQAYVHLAQITDPESKIDVLLGIVRARRDTKIKAN